MTSDLTVTLEGETGEISAASLYAALGSTMQLLHEASNALSLSGGRWNVADLRVGSAVLALNNPSASSAASLVMAGLESLSSRAVIPNRWNQIMVRKARDLGRLAGSGGVLGVLIAVRDGAPLPLTSSLTNHAEQAVQARDVSFGSVRGLVDKWDERSGRRIGLTLDGGETVTATYPARLGERVRGEALGRRIDVRGRIRRNAAGQRVDVIVEDFVVLSEVQPISIDDLAGLYSELGAAGVTSMDVLAHRE